MKPKSNAAIVKSMKATTKKTAYLQAMYAIERKLDEIKKDNRVAKDRPASLALFGYNALHSTPVSSPKTKSRQLQGSPALTSQQLVLF
ncbi:MAG TPA: hypothetical protein VGM41_18115 [Chitinophagaceae bacterium]|jgi:hypothetical protein